MVIQAKAASIPAPISIAQASTAIIGRRRAMSMPCITLAVDALIRPAQAKAAPSTTLSGSIPAKRYSCTSIMAMPAVAITDPPMKARLTGWRWKIQARMLLGISSIA